MKEGYVVLAISRHDFANDKGESVKGAKVIYLDEREDSPNRKGMVPLTIGCDHDMYAKFGPVPGRYDLRFKTKAGPGGKPMLVLVGVSYLEEVVIE